jgi:aerobic-type carbon monoxide dehydrogenase small subunit (CoxS/CutS family)
VNERSGARNGVRTGGRRGGAQGEARAAGYVRIALTVNGERHEVLFSGYKTLLEVLREDLGLTGTKHGCELGECGACAVLLDGRPVLSCLLLAVECDGAEVTTVEGLSHGPALSALQAAFADRGAAQCGYCTPGILVTAQALLDRNPHPTRDEIAEALSGTLCRCTGYLQIFEAVEAAAGSGPPRRTAVLARGRTAARARGAGEPAR